MANELVIPILLLNLLMWQTNFVADMQDSLIMAKTLIIYESIAALKIYWNRLHMKSKMKKRRD